MKKTAKQIADDVIKKAATAGEVATDFLPSAIPGMGLGALTAAFHPRLAKAIPSDKLRMVLGLLGGGLLTGGAGAAGGAIGRKLAE